MTQDTDSGKKDVSSIVKELATGYSKAGQEIAMLLALQKKEWHELRSVPGVILRLLTIQAGKHKILLIAIGSRDDDITGIDATMDIEINGIRIDAIVEKVAAK